MKYILVNEGELIQSFIHVNFLETFGKFSLLYHD